MLEQMNSGPVSAKDIAKASRYDPTISKAMEFTLSGWPQFNTDPNLAPYFKRRNELSTEQGCLIWGQRVVVPSKFRDIVLEELHDCHPEIVKMKALCRSYVWWPGVDEDIQNTVRKCDSCQVQNSRTFTSPMYPWDWPSNPWRRLHVDCAGPIEGKMVLIIIDAHTRFIEAHIVNSATSANTIAKLRQTFATHGLPRDIVSDNGTPFKSELMAEFCEMNGIKQIFVSPYRPASNGLAERAVQSVKNGLRKAKNDQDTLETRLYRFLLHYNKVPQSTTGLPPCELLMKRKLRSRVDSIKPDVRDKVERQQLEMKTRNDAKARCKSFFAGDKVYVRNFIGGIKWLPAAIEEILGPLTYRVCLKDGRIWRRHENHIKLRYTEEPQDITSDSREIPKGNPYFCYK